MRILVVGASGVLGQAVVTALASNEVVEASRSGVHRVDLREPATIGALYAEIGEVDAVVCGRPRRDGITVTAEELDRLRDGGEIQHPVPEM